MLGVQIDRKLNFNNHLETIIKKGSQKLDVFIRSMPYRCISKRKLLINTFFKAQFSDCPLVWVCHSRLMNNKINRPHKRCLRIIYDDKTSSFADLLAKDGSVTIHTRNIHKIMSTELMLGLSCVRQTRYNLRNTHHFAILSVNFVYHGSESISNLAPRIWNLVPHRLKEINSTSPFKNEIKRSQPEVCRCRLCKTYISGVVFCNSL